MPLTPSVRSPECFRYAGRFLVAATLLAGVGACSGGSEPEGPPPDPVRLVAISPTQAAVVGGALVTPSPHVQARNSKGPVPYTPITFDFRGLSPTVTITSGDDGSAEAIWFLPRAMGTFTMVARIAGGDSVVFTAEALAPPPPTMRFYAWPGQTMVGDLTSGITGVEVRDGYGQPMPSIAVRFEAYSGGGTLIGADQITDAEGHAHVGGWRLGPSARDQGLVAIGPNGVRDSILIGAIPARFEAVSDTVQRGYIWKPAPSPPTVRAWDALGKPMTDVAVFFSTISAANNLILTDSTGTARLNPWIADLEPGENLATAYVDGYPYIIFRLIGVTPGPARSVVLSGTGQSGLAGNYLGPRPEIQYFDSAGAPLFHLPVTWTTSAGGFVLKQQTWTDENGITANEGWRLGATIGTQTLTASTQSMAPTTLSANASSVPSRAYDIDVKIVSESPLTAADSNAIDRAVERWEKTIVADLPDIPVTVPDSICGTAVDETVDDVLILLKFVGIDGPWGILGGAAPCIVREGSFLPVIGIIEIDRDDLTNENDKVYNILSHEIGHVLGVGSLWEFKDLLAFSSWVGADVYTGQFGRTAYHGMASNGAFFWKPGALIDNSGIPGTDRAHWAEIENGLHEELMTPYLSPRNILSALTVASLRDLGYLTTDGEAEPFTFPAFSPGIVQDTKRIFLRERDVRRPMVTVGPSGLVGTATRATASRTSRPSPVRTGSRR